MYQNILRNTTLALGTLLVSSSLVFAAATPGNVTALDGKGMGTVHTSDGKDHQVKVGHDFKVGSKVDCEMKNNVMECHLGSPQASAQPASATPTQAKAPMAVKANPTPAPAAQMPAASTPAASTTTAAPAAK